MADLDEDVFTSIVTTKECSGCDPDIPGHVDRVGCVACKGTGREPLSFAAAYAEISESKREEACPKKTGRGSFGDHDYDDDDDTPGDLEY
jgi:hypothetical protein